MLRALADGGERYAPAAARRGADTHLSRAALPDEGAGHPAGKHFGCCRRLYNYVIDVHKEEYRRTGKHLDGYDLQELLPG
jgi:hypothetical protein